ncbi:DUF6928 family protein, partial [Mycobacterium kansasii]
GFRFTHPLAPTDLDPARIQVIDFVPASGVPGPAPQQAQALGPDGAPQPPVEQQDPGYEDRGKVRSFFGF